MERHPIFLNLPNILTLARVFAVPLMVWLVLNDYFNAAFWVFIAAGISDALDGYIAKRFNLVTVLGSYLDPIADKALLVAAYVTLGHAGFVGNWLVILVVFRDALIIGGAILFHTLGRPIKMEPLMISKLNTLVQIVFIAAVLAELGMGIPGAVVVAVLSYIVAATTIFSGLAYISDWVFGIRMPRKWTPVIKSEKQTLGSRDAGVEERV